MELFITIITGFTVMINLLKAILELCIAYAKQKPRNSRKRSVRRRTPSNK